MSGGSGAAGASINDREFDHRGRRNCRSLFRPPSATASHCDSFPLVRETNSAALSRGDFPAILFTQSLSRAMTSIINRSNRQLHGFQVVRQWGFCFGHVAALIVRAGFPEFANVRVGLGGFFANRTRVNSLFEHAQLNGLGAFCWRTRWRFTRRGS